MSTINSYKWQDFTCLIPANSEQYLATANYVAMLEPWHIQFFAGLLARHHCAPLQPIIQAGYCSETLADNPIAMAGDIRRILKGDSQNLSSPLLVIRGFGQFGKPRSTLTQAYVGATLPSYCGHLFNRPAAILAERRFAVENMKKATHRIKQLYGYYRGLDSDFFTSHELFWPDYAAKLTTTWKNKSWYCGCHWPWLGARHLASVPHVKYLASIANPVAVKIASYHEIPTIIHTLNKLAAKREQAEVALILRLGADYSAEWLRKLCLQLHLNSLNPLILIDPLHGNTYTYAGRKTRDMPRAKQEITRLYSDFKACGKPVHGLHLEYNPRRDIYPHAELVDPELTTEQFKILLSHYLEIS